MHGMMPLFLSVLAGICFFAAINHFLIGLKSPKENQEHVAFSALCIVSFLLLLSIVWLYRITTLQEYLEITFYQPVLAPFYYLTMVWFARAFTDVKENRVYPLLILASLFFLSRALIYPHTSIIAGMGGTYFPEQSWLGYHLALIDPIYSPWAGIFLLYVYLNFIYIGYCAISGYRKNHQRGSIFLLITTVVYIALFTLDAYVLKKFGLNVYFSAFCFLPFLLLMSAHMTSERHTRTLADSEGKYKRLLESVQEDYIVFSYLAGTKLIYISPSVEKVLGYTPENLAAGDWQKLASTAGNAASIMQEHASSAQFMADGKMRFDVTILDKNSNPVLFDISLQVLTDATGAVSAIEGFVRDITKQRAYENHLLEFNAELEFRVNERTEALQNALSELRREISEKQSLEQQLIQAQKMESIGQLAGGVAHDFNNIMTAISGFAELAISEGRKGLDTSADLEQVLEAASRGTRLTEQLLSFARKQVATPKVINPGKVLNDAMKFLPRLLSGKAVIAFTCRPETWSIKIDPVQFDQIIINLVVNARDAMLDGFSENEIILDIRNLGPEQAQLLTNVAIPAQEYVCLSVTDTGKGIPLELQQKIFEPFFTTKPIGKGSGLGLSVCYGVVKQHGGYIFVDSDLGEGTTFYILLPRVMAVDKHSPKSKLTKTLSSELSGGSETLLLVEDDPAVAMLTQKILASSGYRVLTASNGLDALDVAERHSGEIDLVITDVMMPKMDGKELADTLRLLSPGIGILCISGYADADIIAELRARGVTFLSKPYTPLQLAKTVRAVLNEKSPQFILSESPDKVQTV